MNVEEGDEGEGVRGERGGEVGALGWCKCPAMCERHN